MLEKLSERGIKKVRRENADDGNHRRLRARDEWTRYARTAKEREKLPPLHSITSSARRGSVGGTARPNALAVLRLMISSAFVACWMGKSAGFSPLRMRPV